MFTTKPSSPSCKECRQCPFRVSPVITNGFAGANLFAESVNRRVVEFDDGATPRRSRVARAKARRHGDPL